MLVAPDGVSDEPTVLRSTGYEYLNQAALDTVVGAEFPETEAPVRYTFAIVVGYDAETCKRAEDILETVQTPESASSDSPSEDAEQNEEDQALPEEDS